MVEVSIATLPGPDGPLTVAATARGLVAAEWLCTEDELRAALVRRLGPVRPAAPDGPAARRLAAALPVLAAALAGAPGGELVAGLPLDLADRPALDQRVLAEVRAVRWGETASYGEIARRVGRAPRAPGRSVAPSAATRWPWWSPATGSSRPTARSAATAAMAGAIGREALERKRRLLAREGVIAHPRDR